jgi:energy-coupling factor transporter ATP-binding protein EcfA2
VQIFPPKIEISDAEGFQAEKDVFKRAQFGHGLADLVAAVEDPMVIALDGQWGSGKTTFIKMWAGLLRKRGHPVIYFDAFANDYIDDAFLAIAGEVIALSQEAKKAKTRAYKKFLTKAARAGRVMLRSGTKIGIKAATLGALDAADFDDFKSIAGDIAEGVGAKADDYIKALLSRHGEERKNIEGFRTALTEIASALSAPKKIPDDGSSNALPLVFIVDELDRCKPPFALDLLEKIKHVFSVEGFTSYSSLICASSKASSVYNMAQTSMHEHTCRSFIIWWSICPETVSTHTSKSHPDSLPTWANIFRSTKMRLDLFKPLHKRATYPCVR